MPDQIVRATRKEVGIPVMGKSYTKAKLSVLELVFPPVSNQEAVWLESDPEAIERLRSSDLYMIGGRAELKFSKLSVDPESRILSFEVLLAGSDPDPVRIDLARLLRDADMEVDEYCVEAGEKIINIRDRPSRDPDSKLLMQFTSERLLLERANGNPAIEGLSRLQDFATYDLLYVGIAKVGDSFDRLMKRGHKARMDILANEPQRFPGARVTDEIYLFLFRIDPLVITTYQLGHDFSEEDFSRRFDNKRVLADAEKAFVSLLKPEYNIVQFKDYPQGSDGLYGGDYDTYGYLIGETIAFDTSHGRIKGKRDPMRGIPNGADCILIEGDTVSLLVSGVDFPEDAIS